MAKKNEAKEESKKPSKSVSKGSNTNLMITWILILVAVQVLLSLGLFFTSGGGSSDSERIESIEDKVDALDEFFINNVDGYRSGNQVAAAENQGSAGQYETANGEIDIEGEPFIGDVNAPVTVVEFSDYECPFCARFFSDAYPQIKRDYVETGKVKFVFKDFPLTFHPLAEPASVAANCVQAQLGNEKYFEYHDTIFENQKSLSIDNLKVWAEELGVDSEIFETCTQSTDQINEVRGDLAEGANLGVSGTPTIFVNDIKLVGAQPYAVIREAIESELNS